MAEDKVADQKELDGFIESRKHRQDRHREQKAKSEDLLLKVITVGDNIPPPESKQLDPTLFDMCEQVGIIMQPLYNPLLWASLLEQNTRLNRCIGAMSLNTVGLGYEFVPIKDSEQWLEENRDEIAREKEVVAPLFAYPNKEYPFPEMMRRIKMDEESTGMGYMEVSRSADDVINGMYHAPSHTIRVLADETGYVQLRGKWLKQLPSSLTGKKPSGQPSEEVVRAAMKEAHAVYFKKFGDDRIMDARTGQFVEPGSIPIEQYANEMIQWTLYTPRSSFYGVPRFVSAAPAITGNRLAQLANVALFENDAVPRMAVIVSGGQLSAKSMKMIEDFITFKGRGPQNRGRVMILQAAPTQAIIDKENKTSIELKPITVGVTDDASWIKYQDRNDEEVREAFGIGKIFLGTATDVNRAVAFCYSADTETLTVDGWKNSAELKSVEKILAVDPTTGRSEFIEAKLHVFDYKGKMHRFENQGTCFEVTPDHNVLYRTEGNAWKRGKASSLAKMNRVFVRTCPDGINNHDTPNSIIPAMEVKRGASKLSAERNKEMAVSPKALAEFVGYFVSEGFLGDNEKTKRYVVGVSQNEEKNPVVAKKIRRCLSKIARFSETSYDDGMVRWATSLKTLWTWLRDNCGKGAANKRLPKDFRTWGKEYLDALWQAMVDGDGHTKPGDNGGLSGTYFTISKTLADQFHELCALTGHRAQIKPVFDKRKNRKPGFVICWTERRDIQMFLKQGEVEEYDYAGSVHCFELPRWHYYVTRNRGKLAVQGNTMKEITLEQTFEPEILRYEYIINATIMRSFGIKYIKFVFKRPQAVNKQDIARSLLDLGRLGGVTPNDVRQERGKEKFRASWGNTPIEVLKLGLMEPSEEGGSEISFAPSQVQGQPPALTGGEEEIEELKAQLIALENKLSEIERKKVSIAS
jgi:capsid portal protein